MGSAIAKITTGRITYTRREVERESLMLAAKITPDTELRLLQLYQADEVFAVVDAEREYLREWVPWVDATKSALDTRDFISKSLGQLAEGINLVLGIWCFRRHSRLPPVRRGESPCRDWLLVVGEIPEAGHHDRRLRGSGEPLVPGTRYGACGTAGSGGKRLGFRQEGVLRHAQLRRGTWDDLVIYGLLWSEWEAASVSRSSSQRPGAK